MAAVRRAHITRATSRQCVFAVTTSAIVKPAREPVARVFIGQRRVRFSSCHVRAVQNWNTIIVAAPISAVKRIRRRPKR
jgi:hypothetical protein